MGYKHLSSLFVFQQMFANFVKLFVKSSWSKGLQLFSLSMKGNCCLSTFGAAMRIEMKCFDCFHQFDKQKKIFLLHAEMFYFRQLSTKLWQCVSWGFWSWSQHVISTVLLALQPVSHTALLTFINVQGSLKAGGILLS